MLLDDNCIRADKILGLHPLASRLFTEPKRPAAQTFAQTVEAAIFFPPWNYGRVSGITGLLAHGNFAGICSISKAVSYIFDEEWLYNETPVTIILPRSPGSPRECVRQFQNRYFSARISFLATFRLDLHFFIIDDLLR